MSLLPSLEKKAALESVMRFGKELTNAADELFYYKDFNNLLLNLNKLYAAAINVDTNLSQRIQSLYHNAYDFRGQKIEQENYDTISRELKDYHRIITRDVRALKYEDQKDYNGFISAMNKKFDNLENRLETVEKGVNSNFETLQKSIESSLEQKFHSLNNAVVNVKNDLETKITQSVTSSNLIIKKDDNDFSARLETKKLNIFNEIIKSPLKENIDLLNFAEKWCLDEQICASNQYFNEAENRRLEKNNPYHRYTHYHVPSEMKAPETASEHFAKGYYKLFFKGNKSFLDSFNISLVMGLNKAIVYICRGIANYYLGNIVNGNNDMNNGLKLDPGLLETSNILRNKASDIFYNSYRVGSMIYYYEKANLFILNKLINLNPSFGEAYYIRSCFQESKDEKLKDLLKAKELGFDDAELENKIKKLSNKVKISQ